MFGRKHSRARNLAVCTSSIVLMLGLFAAIPAAAGTFGVERPDGAGAGHILIDYGGHGYPGGYDPSAPGHDASKIAPAEKSEWSARSEARADASYPQGTILGGADWDRLP